MLPFVGRSVRLSRRWGGMTLWDSTLPRNSDSIGATDICDRCSDNDLDTDHAILALESHFVQHNT